MRNHVRKYVLILLMVLTALLCTAGASTWILLSEKTVSAPKPFTPIETKINTTNVVTQKIYAGNESASTITGLKVEAGDIDVTSFFEVSYDYTNIYKAKGTATELKANVVVSFKVKKEFETSYKYTYAEPTPETVSVSLEPVAYCGNAYYSTVDTAISSTSSGTITVIPTRSYDMEMKDSTQSLQTAKRAKTITTATEIQAGVTLSLPYTTTTVTDYFDTSNNYSSNYILGIAKNTSGSYKENNQTKYYYPEKERSTSAYRNNPTKYLKNNITIASGHTLTNNGTIEIGGVISGGNGGQALNCYTVVDYAQITLQASAKLQSNGTINNYGFIASDETYTGAQKPQLLLEDGTLKQPFTLVEHRGGTIFAGVFFDGGGSLAGATSNPKGIPFSRFYMENVLVETKISANAEVVSYVNLWASSSSNEDTFLLIGNTSEAFIQLANNSYIISNFSSTEVKDYLDFYGDFSINSMQLSVISRNISSSNSHFPVSNHYAITLNKIPNATKNAKVTFNQKIKVMQGGSLIVNQGVDLTANEIAVYTKNCFDKTKAAAAGYQYPTELADGKFIVNGSLTTSSNIGGLIQTTVDHATIKLSGGNSTFSYELSGGTNSFISGSATYVEVEKTLSVPLLSGSTTSSVGTYYSKNGKWYSTDFKVIFDANGGTGGTTINVKDEIENHFGANGGYMVTFPETEPTRKHYEFDHWCTKQNCTSGDSCTDKYVSGTAVFGETTIYASWTPLTYYVKYEITYASGITPITKGEDTFSVTNPLTPTLPTSSEGKNFFGWYSDPAMQNPITTISTALLDNGTLTKDSDGKIIVYGKFVNEYKITFYVNNAEIINKLGKNVYHHDDYATPNVVYGNVPDATAYDTDKEITVRFAGWKDGNGKDWTPNLKIEANTELYAQWTAKYILSFNTTTNNGNVQVTAPKSVYLISGQSHDLSVYTDAITVNDMLMDKTKYFGGWYNGTTRYTSISINGNTTLTAKWLDKTKVEFVSGEQNAFATETYYLFDGQSISTSTAIQNAITNFNNNTQNTHIFIGWSDGATTYNDIVITMDSSVNKTLTAQWQRKAEIKFIDPEGIFKSETHNPTEEQYPFTTPTSIINAINAQNANTYEIRYFVGWSDGENLYNDIVVTVNLSDGMKKFTAVWADKYLVTVKDVIENNKKVEKTYYIIPSESFELSSALVTAINEYSRNVDTTQYFAGWNGATNKDATLSIAEVIQDVTYTANWQTKFVVTIGGLVEGNNNSVSKVYHIIPGESFELSSALVTAINEYSGDVETKHYFAGWNVATDKDATLSIAEVIQDVTYTANWKMKVVVTVDYDGAGTNSSERHIPGTIYTIPQDPSKTGYDFKGWTVTGGTIDGDKITLPTTDDATVALKANFELTKIKVTISVSGAEYVTYSVKVGDTTLENDSTVTMGQTIQVEATKTEGGKDPTVTIAGSNVNSYTVQGTETSIDIEIEGGKQSCFASGTLITLADGTQKAVENLTTDDILLVFNHETGKYDTAGITFIENDGWNYYNVINLTFSDGTHTKLIYEHALFDVTLNKYVYITESNYAEFVGHTFVSQEGDRYTEVVLTNAYVAKEYTGCYSLVTVYHLNYFIDGLLSIPGGIEGLFNIFEYGEGLKFDEEKMQADIEKYGLYTYEDFKAYIPEEIYYAFPAPYLKVAVGKGLLTFDTILQYIEQFIVKNGLM